MTLWNQMTTSLGTLIGTSVARMQGIIAEKNRIEEIDKTATMNLVISWASATSNAGRKISEMEMAAAFAVSKGSGTCNAHVNG
mgnify:CR=1 FL=1